MTQTLPGLSTRINYAFTFDEAGNRQSLALATGIVTEYAWDHRNRLTRVTEKPSATSPPSQFVEFAYDVLDRRVSQSIDADADGTADRVTYFVVDGRWSDNDGAGDHVLLTLTDHQNTVRDLAERDAATGVTLGG